MSVDERVLEVVDSLYAAAMDEALWSDALKKVADLTGSQAASLWVLDGSAQPRLPTFTYINLDPAFIKEYLDEVAPLDPTVQYLLRHPTQPVVHDAMFITEREKDWHPYYDWHHRWSDLRFRLVGQISPAPCVQAGIALHRARQVGRYEAVDIEQMSYLHRHIERALSIGFKLGSLGTLERCTTELLDRNPVAIVLLDGRGRVVYKNRAADGLCSSQDGLRFAENGISLTHKGDNDKLQRLIAQALSPVSPDSRAGGAMRTTPPSGKPPYSVLVGPVSLNYPLLSSVRPAVCVAISGAAQHGPMAIQRLRAVFNLTEAEARLAISVAAGDGLRTAAAKLGISYGSARVRLSEIFCKTNTHRQGELIGLLIAALALG
ncbi:MAG: hypothetical protein JJU27_02365 [Gammaproteobacteria bacterium]|nr:hypothetical protein [Gammaproteobacteria bacterium]